MTARRFMIHTLAIAVGIGAGVADRPAAQGQVLDPLGKVATIEIPASDEVRALAMAWLEEQQADDAQRAAAESIWSDAEGEFALASPLDRLAATLALADERVAELVAQCAGSRPLGPLPDRAWLADETVAALVRHNMRLYYGRWLSQQVLYDEALEQLTGIEPGDVVDPAALLFYQSVVHHRLLNKTEGLQAINRLLTEVVAGPPRYLTVAGLMREDLKGLEDDSLDHIARRMDDVGRVLDLGRAGEKVRDKQDGIIASLDKLIEELEEQQRQQQQQQSGGSGGSQQPNQAMPDSRLARASGAGQVDRRNVGRGAGWGDLPAKEREEALQQIGKDFPSHYREVIEQYFRKLAAEEGADR